MRRWLWRFLYPFALIGHKAFGLSYAYVNRGYAAWRRDLFNPIVHYQWFGDRPDCLPERVVLCGIGYLVTQYRIDRDVCFHAEDHFGSFYLRCASTGNFWSVEDVNGNVPVCHVAEAADWCEATVGVTWNGSSN